MLAEEIAHRAKRLQDKGLAGIDTFERHADALERSYAAYLRSPSRWRRYSRAHTLLSGLLGAIAFISLVVFTTRRGFDPAIHPAFILWLIYKVWSGGWFWFWFWFRFRFRASRLRGATDDTAQAQPSKS